MDWNHLSEEKERWWAFVNTVMNLLLLLLLLLSLAPQPTLGFGLFHKIRLNFVEAYQQFSFLQGRVAGNLLTS
jgi:hypothetical protein